MITQIMEALTMMDWAVILAEFAGASLLVTLGCIVWARFRIYRMPVVSAVYRPEKKELREFRTPVQMKLHILGAIQQLKPDAFNQAGMFMFQGDLERLGGSLEPAYLDQLDALMQAEGLSLILSEKEAPAAINKPLWVRPHAIDYYLLVMSNQTGFFKELHESARRLVFIWMRCATAGLKSIFLSLFSAV